MNWRLNCIHNALVLNRLWGKLPQNLYFQTCSCVDSHVNNFYSWNKWCDLFIVKNIWWEKGCSQSVFSQPSTGHPPQEVLHVLACHTLQTQCKCWNAHCLLHFYNEECLNRTYQKCITGSQHWFFSLSDWHVLMWGKEMWRKWDVRATQLVLLCALGEAEAELPGKL